MGHESWRDPEAGYHRWLMDAALLALMVLVSLLAIKVHRIASLTLPVPWGDEAFFLWQAQAFERANTFIAPEMDASRPILLLPFVYPGLLGLLFKLTGCSLGLARDVSLALVITGFGMLVTVMRRRSSPFVSALIISAFMLNARFVVMGNVARMEALLFAMVVGAALLLERGRSWEGLAVLSLAPMVHPNAVLYLVPAAIYVLATGGLRGSRPTRLALALFVLSAIIWLAHAAYVLAYWDGFVHDTAHRLGEAAAETGRKGIEQLRGWHLYELFAIGGVAALARWRHVRVGGLLVFALGAWMHGRLRIEQWYEAFGDLVYLLLALAVVQIATDAVVPVASAPRAWARSLVAGATATAIVGFLLRHGTLDGPNGYFRELTLAGMHVGPPGAYFEHGDRDVLRTFLASQNPSRPIVVEVHPWSDAFLFADLADDRVRYQLPFFGSLVRPPDQWIWGYTATDLPTPDVTIVHVSRYTPSFLRPRTDSLFARAERNPELGARSLIHSRDTTEFWYALRRAASGPMR
jgi:hypothetical protein